MYVPPDEPVQDLGEINMSYQAEDMRRLHDGYSTHGATYEETGALSAVNPIYTR